MSNFRRALIKLRSCGVNQQEHSLIRAIYRLCHLRYHITMSLQSATISTRKLMNIHSDNYFVFQLSHIPSISKAKKCIFTTKMTNPRHHTHFLPRICIRGWSGGAMVLGKLPLPGRPTIWMMVGSGPIALAVGVGGGCFNIFTLLYPFSPLSPSLWETARYRLKYCLEGPLNPKQPTNVFVKSTFPLQFCKGTLALQMVKIMTYLNILY